MQMIFMRILEGVIQHTPALQFLILILSLHSKLQIVGELRAGE